MEPVLRNCASLVSHGGHISEGRGPSVEVIFEGFNFSLVFGDLTLKDTSTNTVAGGDSNWTSKDTSGTSTINFGSHVFLPVLEFPGFTIGGCFKGSGSGGHGGIDSDQFRGKFVEFGGSLSAVLIGRFEGVDKDSDGGFVDCEVSALEHVTTIFEGDS